MTRRRLVALVSAVSMLAIGIIAMLVLASVTGTSYGRDKVRNFLQSRIAAKVKGSVHIGRISGGLLSGVTIDSLEIRDTDDSLFIATGPITVQYDIRDFFDRRILLERLEVERPIVRIAQHENGDWNYRRIFPRGPRRLPDTQGGYGDYIVIDTAAVRGGSLIVTLPWHPDDSLRGVRRDSAIAAHLARTDAEFRRSAEGFSRTRRWTELQVASTYVRWADPDSVGRFFDIRALSAVESDPPIRLTAARGNVRILADSAWIDIPHFELPGSAGAAKGKVVWGSSLPTRYAVKIEGDTVSMSDVAWVYPTLPTTGGGVMDIEIRSRRNPQLTDFIITKMDVRTTRSRLKGDMTFGIGGRVLEVTDVALEALPIDFALLTQFNGGPLPVDWQGTIRGTVRGRGGPVTRFIVDDARVSFADAHVPGATTTATARGELDILYPALTAFRGFEVDVGSLDLRTIEFLFPNFPRLGGTVAGRATLDSSWLDVRFRDADVTHTDGPAPPNRFTGSGRAKYGEPFMIYDVDLVAAPISFTTLSRSYPLLPLRGTYQGPVRAKGTSENLDVTATLTGPAGRLAFDGRVDIDPPGLAVRGHAEIAELDVARLLERSDIPITRLTAQFEADLLGDSLADLAGPLAVDIDRSRVGDVNLRPSRVRLTFANGRVRVETLSIASNRFNLAASGRLGTAVGVRDSLSYHLAVDSLGALRQYLRSDTANAETSFGAPEDSLGGSIDVRGWLAGGVDRLDLTGEIRGSELVIGVHRAASLTGTLEARDLLGIRSGRLALRLDTALVGGIQLSSVATTLAMRDPEQGRVSFVAQGPSVGGTFSADVRRTAALTELLIDTLAFGARNAGQWWLSAPTRVALAGADVAIDQTTIVSDNGGRIALRGTLPDSGTIAVRIDADSVNLRDVRALTQRATVLDGWVDLGLSIAGTRAAPTMTATMELASARFADVRAERVSGEATYANRRLEADLGLFRAGARAIQATLSVPIDLALVPVAQRMLDEPLRGVIRADSVDLSVLEAFTSQIQNVHGAIGAQVTLGGTARAPTFTGGLAVYDGGMRLPLAGITLERVNADIVLAGDSLRIRRLSAMSGVTRGDTAWIRGSVNFADLRNPGFALTFNARNFHAVQLPRVADLTINSAVRLSGRRTAAVLTGTVTATQGALFIPELVEKRLVSVRDLDTTTAAGGSRAADASAFVENLQVQDVQILVGNDVWLRSSEAHIQLGGGVSVRTVRTRADPGLGFNQEPAAGDSASRLALEGTLSADRGTYRLNLGVVQRTFQVEQGRVVFFGEAELNPTLDISAVHNVRTSQNEEAGRDVRVRVRIFGTLEQPQIELSSADATVPMSTSDLLSYLVTGSPSFELGASGNENLNTAAAILLPTLGSYLGDRFAGGALDLFQIEAATPDRFGTERTTSALDLLLGTRIGVGKQLGKRTFVSANTNLCQLDDLLGRNLDTTKLFRSIGVTLEHRLNNGFSAALSVEPGSTALLCTNSAQSGFLSTPRQLGADLFKVWRF